MRQTIALGIVLIACGASRPSPETTGSARAETPSDTGVAVDVVNHYWYCSDPLASLSLSFCFSKQFVCLSVAERTGRLSGMECLAERSAACFSYYDVTNGSQESSCFRRLSECLNMSHMYSQSVNFRGVGQCHVQRTSAETQPFTCGVMGSELIDCFTLPELCGTFIQGLTDRGITARCQASDRAYCYRTRSALGTVEESCYGTQAWCDRARERDAAPIGQCTAR
jgi:hypothetical protein